MRLSLQPGGGCNGGGLYSHCDDEWELLALVHKASHYICRKLWASGGTLLDTQSNTNQEQSSSTLVPRSRIISEDFLMTSTTAADSRWGMVNPFPPAMGI